MSLGREGLPASLERETAFGPEGGSLLCRDGSVAPPRALPELEGGAEALFAQGPGPAEEATVEAANVPGESGRGVQPGQGAAGELCYKSRVVFDPCPQGH